MRKKKRRKKEEEEEKPNIQSILWWRMSFVSCLFACFFLNVFHHLSVAVTCGIRGQFAEVSSLLLSGSPGQTKVARLGSKRSSPSHITSPKLLFCFKCGLPQVIKMPRLSVYEKLGHK